MKNQPSFLPILPLLMIACLSLIASIACADAPLKTTLGLNIEQAAKVDEIQAKARDAVRPVRGDLNREERVLRRARIDNDAAAIARQEKLIEPLRVKLAAIFADEEKQIRTLLTPEQTDKYEEYLKVRDQMAGSSRDVKEIKKPAAKAAE